MPTPRRNAAVIAAERLAPGVVAPWLIAAGLLGVTLAMIQPLAPVLTPMLLIGLGATLLLRDRLAGRPAAAELLVLQGAVYAVLLLVALLARWDAAHGELARTLLTADATASAALVTLAIRWLSRSRASRRR
ncbi:hypothetical protein [Pseudobythopirellula maris]|nr:hypothetical protein [Pseudobythopirellula maris]